MVYSARVARYAFWSIPVAAAVMGLKFVAWKLTGSVALFSDALESIINVIAALMAWQAVRLSNRPADANHPFGHHKAEYFSAVVEGALIIVAALAIIREATLALSHGPDFDANPAGLAVNAFAALVNGVWASLLIRAGREDGSPALSASGRHVWADVLTSIGVLLGLGLATVTGFLALDAILAVAVALNILREGWLVVRGSVGGLMDEAVDGDEAAAIERAIRAAAGGTIEAHDIRARRAGPVLFVEFHLVVDGWMSVSASHVICDRIEAAIRAHEPQARISIHVEPEHKAKDEGVSVG